MGSTFISRSALGYDIGKVFDEIHQNEREQYGEDYYSAHMGSARLGRCTTITTGMYDEVAKLKVQQAIDEESENGYNTGNVVRGIDAGIVEYQLVTIKKVTHKKTESTKPKWQQMFCVISHGKTIYSGTDKKVAEEKMLKEALYNPDVEMHKEYRLVKGTSLEAYVKVTTKTLKKKPTKIPKGAMLRELHKYYYFGWVSE